MLKIELSVKRQNDQKQRKLQQLLTNRSLAKSDFNMGLCQEMLSTNIPLNKLSNNTFRIFLEEYTGKNILKEATLRKGYIDDIFNTSMDKMKIR
jgi:chromatin remodeling complex protein RSC6